ncbi:MAG: hypothetical protein ACREHV_03965 [Rhizomicrobium sp.]
MTRIGAAGSRILAFGILAAATGFSLSGCASIDNMLFGGTEEAAPAPANGQAAAPPAAAPAVAPPAAAPAEAAPGPQGAVPAPAPVASAPMPPPSLAGEFTPVTVAPGSPTGTSVSQTIGTLRSQLEGLETKLASDAQHFADLRNTETQDASTYQDATGRVSAHLAAGTTRGNPELIGEWNTAQGALDSLTGNINALGQLASGLSGDSSAAHQEFDTIQSTFDVPGAVDEDHRQLGVLSDETGETIVLIDRLLRDVKQALDRQTAYVASERGNLTMLARAIKAGEYSPTMPPPRRAAAAARKVSSSIAAAVESGGPIVTIRFDRAHVSYDRKLYSALSQALAAKPSASFSVVGVSPARGTGSGVELAQNSAQEDAQAVMRSMGEMGVPAARMDVSSSTDPQIASSEVRVYVK